MNEINDKWTDFHPNFSRLDMSNYKSPITMIESPIADYSTQIMKQFEDEQTRYLVETVHSYGFIVDAEELKKALMYDRHQYEKGYRDACGMLPQNGRWIKQEDTYTTETGETFSCYKVVCSVCGRSNTFGDVPYCPYCGAKNDPLNTEEDNDEED